jgi:hypothetical protein
MADRKQFSTRIKPNPELLKLLEKAKNTPVTEEILQEQRISFAFGNAPASADYITKDSVRRTSHKIKLL